MIKLYSFAFTGHGTWNCTFFRLKVFATLYLAFLSDHCGYSSQTHALSTLPAAADIKDTDLWRLTIFISRKQFLGTHIELISRAPAIQDPSMNGSLVDVCFQIPVYNHPLMKQAQQRCPQVFQVQRPPDFFSPFARPGTHDFHMHQLDIAWSSTWKVCSVITMSVTFSVSVSSGTTRFTE